MKELSDDDLREYAADIILDHAKDVEYLSIFEMAEGRVVEEGEELSEADGRRVDDLIGEAIIRVSWRGHDYVYGNGFEDDEDESE